MQVARQGRYKKSKMVAVSDADTPRCKKCSKPLVRRPKEKRNYFLRRKHCRECYDGHITILEKTCAECGATFKRRKGEAYAKFLARNTCSKLCHMRTLPKKPRKVFAEKHCEYCQKNLERKPWEHSRAYAVRKTCNIVCNNRLMGKRRREKRIALGIPLAKPKPRPKVEKTPKPKVEKTPLPKRIEVTKPKPKLLIFGSMADFKPELSTHQTIHFDDKEVWQEIKKCTVCGTRDASYFTGVCDVCQINQRRQ